MKKIKAKNHKIRIAKYDKNKLKIFSKLNKKTVIFNLSLFSSVLLVVIATIGSLWGLSIAKKKSENNDHGLLFTNVKVINGTTKPMYLSSYPDFNNKKGLSPLFTNWKALIEKQNKDNHKENNSKYLYLPFRDGTLFDPHNVVKLHLNYKILSKWKFGNKNISEKKRIFNTLVLNDVPSENTKDGLSSSFMFYSDNWNNLNRQNNVKFYYISDVAHKVLILFFLDKYKNYKYIINNDLTNLSNNS